MTNEAAASDQPDLRSWVRATTFGWWLGFALIVLGVLAGEAVAGGGEGAQFMIGVGMGAGVGYLQGRRLRAQLGSRVLWPLASTVGMGAPFVVGDVARGMGLTIPYSLVSHVAVGGLCVAVLQWLVLRRHSTRAVWWVPACVIGWTAPVALVSLKDGGVVTGVPGEVVALIGMFFGGTILGVVTGGIVGRILNVYRSNMQP